MNPPKHHGKFRLTVNGVVIDHDNYSTRCLHYFFDHLKNALTNAEAFVFSGYGGRHGAANWLEFHRLRLKLTTWAGAGIKILDREGNTLESFTAGNERTAIEPVHA